MVAGLVVVALASRAHAQAPPPPPNVWTQFQSGAPHASIASLACTLGARAVVGGVSRPLSLDAFEDGRSLCVGPVAPDALRGRVKTTVAQGQSPSTIVVELDVPPGASPAVVADTRNVLVNMAADLERRSSALPPVVVGPPLPPPEPPPPNVPMHPVKTTNTPFVIAGAATFGASFVVDVFISAAIAGASGNPGTERAWPFVPFFGLVVFSATYQEAAGCDCAAGRAFSILGSVVLDAAQIAGAVLTIYGLATSRTRMEPGVALRVGPMGAALEGRF